MPRETSIKNAIVRRILDSGRWARRFPSDVLTGAGMPDIGLLLLRPFGRAMWLEVKKEGEEPTKIQLAMMKQLCDGGAAVAVVHSVDEAMDAIREAEKQLVFSYGVAR